MTWDERTDLVSRIVAEVDDRESPAVVQAVRFLESSNRKRGFVDEGDINSSEDDDDSALKESVLAAVSTAALTSPYPGRYLWALGKVPDYVPECLLRVLKAMPNHRLNEEVLWQATVALENSLDTVVEEENSETLNKLDELVMKLSRLLDNITSEAATELQRLRVHDIAGTLEVLRKRIQKERECGK